MFCKTFAKTEQQICVHSVKSRYAENVARNYAKLAGRDDREQCLKYKRLVGGDFLISFFQ